MVNILDQRTLESSKKYSLIHTASLSLSLDIQIGDTTLLNSTSLFSLDTETEFMTKLWTNQESVLMMIGEKTVSDIFVVSMNWGGGFDDMREVNTLHLMLVCLCLFYGLNNHFSYRECV